MPLLFSGVGQCMNIEVRANLQEFIQSPLLQKVGVFSLEFTKFLTLPDDIKASEFGYDIIINDE